MSSEVLQQVQQLTHPIPPPCNAWSFLSPSANARQYEGDARSLIAGLQGHFSNDALVEAGVARSEEGENLSISPVVDGDAPSFLFLRRDKDEPPFDLVNMHGQLASDAPPCFTACEDYFTDAWCRHTGKVILATANMLDLAILRSLSLPVTVAAGLDSLTGLQLRLLCGPPKIAELQHSAICAGSESGNRAAICRRRMRVALVDWNVARLSHEKHKSLRSAITFLTEAEAALGFDIDHVRVWRPTKADFRQIFMSVRARDIELIQEVIRSSMRRCLYGVSRYAGGDKPAKNIARGYADARRALLEDIQRGRGSQHSSFPVSAKLDEIQQSFDCEVLGPILDEAMSASAGPVERALLLGAAEVVEHLHATSALVRNAADGRDPRTATIGTEEMKERLQLLDRLVRIQRELARKQ